MLLADRIVADARDGEAWAAARDGKIGASDAAKFAKAESVDLYVASKLMPAWDGSQFSGHGHEREPIILADHGYEQNHFTFHHAEHPRFLATPDGIRLGPTPRLAQAKTTIKDFISKRTGEVLVPAHYRRQVWWEQFVMGPEYTVSDFIYERYELINGVCVPELESHIVLIERDDEQIAKMVAIAVEVCRRLDLSAI